MFPAGRLVVWIFPDDVLTQQAARVVPPLQARADGTYVVQLREFDPSAYSDDTAVTDTVPSLGDGYASNKAPIVTTLRAVYSTADFQVVGMGTTGIYTGRVVVGDTTRDTVLGGTDVRLPNDVPLYTLTDGGTPVGILKMNSSNEVELGHSAYPLFFQGTNIILGAVGGILGDPTYQATIIDWNESAAGLQVGDGGGSYDTLIKGNSMTLDPTLQLDLSPANYVKHQQGDEDCKCYGYHKGAAAAPTTAVLAIDRGFCIWEDTGTSTFTWFFNDGTTIRQIS